MPIALKKRMCLSLSDALETEPVLTSEEPCAALHDAMPHSSLCSSLPCSSLPRVVVVLPPPGVRPARLPLWCDLLCFQLVMIVVVFVGAAMPAAMLVATLVVCLMLGLLLLFFVKVLGMKNEATLLEQFLLCKKGDVIDLKMLAEHLSVVEDLLTDCVFENGLDVTQSQTVATIDAMIRVMEQREALLY